MRYRRFTDEQVASLSEHARAVLLAFDDVDWPRFENDVLHAIPVLDLPLSLCECNVSAALEELAAAGLTDPVKPDPRLCLRRYWPEGRIWTRRGAEVHP